MNELQTAVYHAWLRQQLGVTDIQPGDFAEQEPYFQHRIQSVIDHPSDTVRTAHQAYVYHIMATQNPGAADAKPGDPAEREVNAQHRIRNVMDHPSGTLKTVYQAYVNTLASQLAHNMDGTQLNNHRQLTGKSYRRDVTQAYVDTLLPITTPQLWFIYEPYTGITSDIDSDWTAGYAGLIPMGRLTFHHTPEDRQRSLYDPDTGERWPSNEIWPVEYQEALYHLLRTNQISKDWKGWAAHCGQDECEYPCAHDTMAKEILDATWEHFLSWKGQHNNIR